MEEPDPRGRKRYVGFRVHVDDGPTPDRRAMVETLDSVAEKARLPRRKRLTLFTGELGIARFEHVERDAMVKGLGSVDRIGGRAARIETLVTSGTIKKVKEHLGLGRDD
jgi:RNase P/RNase MRP subunit POP5